MNFGDRYGRLDRLLHDVAFGAGTAQRTMADLEEMLWGDRLEGVPLEDPVFVTALPRSGTTILLKLLVESGRFASHTYRDMPFVLCPLLWSRFSARFAVDDDPVERAHGDGLRVSADSPEAFEEMIWKHFWPERYRDDRILPWTGPESRPAFDRFLEAHMRKVVALRRGEMPWTDDGGPPGAGPGAGGGGPGAPGRYVSKNNLNVARIASPPRPLRRGRLVIPFREPVQQAASMRRQHRRFLEIHERDDFVRRYMEAIGHHEFGKGLRPVDFGGWLEAVGWEGAVAGAEPPGGDAADPTGLAFWLRYWVAAYGHVLEHAGPAAGGGAPEGGDGGPSAHLVSYARLTSGPEAALGRLAGAVGIPSADLTPLADRLQPPRDHDVDEASLPADLVEEARALYEDLEGRAPV